MLPPLPPPELCNCHHHLVRPTTAPGLSFCSSATHYSSPPSAWHQPTLVRPIIVPPSSTHRGSFSFIFLFSVCSLFLQHNPPCLTFFSSFVFNTY